MKTRSEKITDGIRVVVQPEFIQEDETPEGTKYLFSYRVEIRNMSSKWVKLLSRHWLIIDSEGKEVSKNSYNYCVFTALC